MQKILKIIVSIIVLIIVVYAVSYLSLRKVKTLDRQGNWVIYFYGDAYVRQYAIDKQAQVQFSRAVERGNKPYLVGHEGDEGKNWFCVYRKPNTKIYRIFRLAELIENNIIKSNK